VSSSGVLKSGWYTAEIIATGYNNNKKAATSNKETLNAGQRR